MTIKEYTANMRNVIAANHPRTWARWKDSPKDCWRYICRSYGHGLAPYTDKEIKDVVQTLYGSWFIALDFTTDRPNIDAKEFNEWIYDAVIEARKRYA